MKNFLSSSSSDAANVNRRDIFPKRKLLINSNECKVRLGEDLRKLFVILDKAIKKYNKEISHTSIEARRARGFEASLMNAKLIDEVIRSFPDDWAFGRYLRFVLRRKGLQILFKKLNKYDMPMNIRTKSVKAIENQQLSIWTDDVNDVEEPVLFFGYKKMNWVRYVIRNWFLLMKEKLNGQLMRKMYLAIRLIFPIRIKTILVQVPEGRFL